MNETHPTEPVTHPDTKRTWRPLDRMLLFAILCLQGVIFYGLFLRMDGHPPAAGKSASPNPGEGAPTAATLPEADKGPATPLTRRQPGATSLSQSSDKDARDPFAGFQENMDRYLMEMMRRPVGLAGHFPMARPTSLFASGPAFFDDRMDRMFEQALGDLRAMTSMGHFDDGWSSLVCSPTMDMRDRDNDYLVVFSLPGLDAAGINVMLEGRLLTVSSHASSPAGASPYAFHFERRVWLPGPVADASDATATLTNGVLTVIVPKSEDMPTDAVAARLL